MEASRSKSNNRFDHRRSASNKKGSVARKAVEVTNGKELEENNAKKHLVTLLKSPTEIKSSKEVPKLHPVLPQPGKAELGNKLHSNKNSKQKKEEHISSQLGPFSRLENPGKKASIGESPYMKSGSTRTGASSRTVVQCHQGSNQAIITNKGKFSSRIERGKLGPQTAFGRAKLVEAAPYGYVDPKIALLGGPIKEARPCVIPKTDISSREFEDLYQRQEFYRFEEFFGIEQPDDPFAIIGKDGNDFSIDVVYLKIVKGT